MDHVIIGLAGVFTIETMAWNKPEQGNPIITFDGETLPVRPVVLFPGWCIEDSRSRRKDLWVLEPKDLPKSLSNATSLVAPEDVALASFHLSRFIREQERAFEARK